MCAMKIVPISSGFRVKTSVSETVAQFDIKPKRRTRAQAKSDAQAWVDGVIAKELVGKIRNICCNQNEPAARLSEIVELLKDQPQPT